eukprot:CAMPEP_0202917384 /NCGR_PEP_ID=MMETSP1392-20130828/70896_1 /ASSEMBLY_ACC=CAM_ASM_000868 /TAXON_ID=225041 /ORGANISM="Chlamydomonas chlamydogama, Strain SAG 11-48b" /LENGTH=38 /DNA_ID= /DNA_START= /DNA_END= /DNA_ORIENTATION=
MCMAWGSNQRTCCQMRANKTTQRRLMCGDLASAAGTWA